MTFYNLEFKLKTRGAIYAFLVAVEGKELKNFYYDPASGSWIFNLPGYPVTGALDLFLVCQGINGASCSLEVKVNTVILSKKLKAVVKNGVGEDAASIPLKPKAKKPKTKPKTKKPKTKPKAKA